MLFPRRVDSAQTRKSSNGPEDEVGFRLVLKALLQVDLLRKNSCHTGTMFPALRKAKRSGAL